MGEIIRRTKGDRFLGWYIRYRDADGKRKQRATHQPSKELARRFLVEVEARIARGNIGIPEPTPASAQVSELCARFLAEYTRPRIKDISRFRMDARKRLRRCLPIIGNRPADLLTPQEVGKLRDQLSRKMAPGSVGDAISTLGRVFNWAVQQKLLQTNPVRGVERPKSAYSYDFYSREEVTAILVAAEARTHCGKLPALSLAACVRLALHTGMRKGELLGLRWRDLDLKTLRLTVARSYKTLPKSGKARHIRLPSDCVPSLQRWQEVCPASVDGEVFPPFRGTGSTSQAMLGLPKLLAEAGVRSPAHPWHACRHTFASHYMMAGGNILALQKILGHSDVKMTMIYAHLAPDYLGEEMERLKF